MDARASVRRRLAGQRAAAPRWVADLGRLPCRRAEGPVSGRQEQRRWDGEFQTPGPRVMGLGWAARLELRGAVLPARGREIRRAPEWGGRGGRWGGSRRRAPPPSRPRRASSGSRPLVPPPRPPEKQLRERPRPAGPRRRVGPAPTGPRPWTRWPGCCPRSSCSARRSIAAPGEPARGPRCAEARPGSGDGAGREPPAAFPRVCPMPGSPVSVPRLPPCLPPSSSLPRSQDYLPLCLPARALLSGPCLPPALRPCAVRCPGAEPALLGGTRASEPLPILPEPRSAWLALGPWPRPPLGRPLAGGCPSRRGLRALQAGAAGWVSDPENGGGGLLLSRLSAQVWTRMRVLSAVCS